MPDKRSASRKAVGLLVKLGHRGVDDFVHRYATNLSSGGMFIRTREPKPVGTELRFRVEIADGQRVLQGTGVVRWARGPEAPVGPPGMGIEFVSLDTASRALVERMLRSRPSAAVVAPLTPVQPLKLVPPPPPSDILLESGPSAVTSTVSSTVASAPSWLFETHPSDAALALPLPLPLPVPVPAGDSTFITEADAVSPGGGSAHEAPASSAPAAPEPEQEVFSTVVATGGPGPSSGPSPIFRDFSSEIELDLADLVASTPEPPPPPPSPPSDPSSPVGLEFDIDLELVSTAAPQGGSELEKAARKAADSFPGLRRESPRAAEVSAVALAPTLTPGRELRPPALPTQGAAPPPPAPAPAPCGPVFLRPVAPAAGTGLIIGIDLGTTNSACAVLSKGRPLILTSKDGYNTIPSVVALSPQGKVLVGHRAKAQMILNPTQSVFGAKRLVGRAFDSPTVRHVRERFHYEICEGEEGRAAVRLGPHVLTLEEVQGLVLRECKEMAEQTLGQPVSRAVVTCPAYYSEPQREAVRRAGQMAGLKVERILNEPTAAALAFGMNRELTKTVLVYDLGGGTFDATVLKLDKNVFEVLATGGDVFLGGVDFDNQIVDLLLERYARQHGQGFDGDRVALSRVAEAAERAKVALSERTSIEVHLPMLELDAAGAPRDLKCTVTRAEVEAACEELIDRTIQAVQDVLLDAKLKAAAVDDVILVGGMSRMPKVRDALQKLFKRPAHASVNADEAVALGAALYTGNVDKVSSVVLIDVVPMTIGLGKPGGGFHRLIERNTPLPATKSFGVATHEDNQQVLEVMLFQGEDSNVAGNELVGAVRLDGLPRGPKGSVQVAISLSLDAECVLKVEAREFRTRKAVQTTLATRFTAEELAARLHLNPAQGAQAQQSRAAELERRAGGFWSRLKKAFGRR